MPTISILKRIKVCIYGRDHILLHFHTLYRGSEIFVSIEELEVLEGTMASKQLKMLLDWAAFRQEEL